MEGRVNELEATVIRLNEEMEENSKKAKAERDKIKSDNAT